MDSDDLDIELFGELNATISDVIAHRVSDVRSSLQGKM